MTTYNHRFSAFNRIARPLKLVFALCIYTLCLPQIDQAQSRFAPFPLTVAADTSNVALGTNGKIAFVRSFDETSDIFAMNPDGSGQVNFTNDRNPDSSPAWSPDGSKIAFAKHVQSDDGWNIYVMNADSSNLRKITFNARVFDLNVNDPAWSPDGKKIALVSTLHGSFSSLIVMNADGSEPRIINQGWHYKRPAWSPDGAKIAFVGRPSLAANELANCAFVINADGSGKTCIANNLWPFSGPAWSPDGTKLLYSRVENPNDPHRSIANIYVVNGAGGNPTQLTNARAFDTDPVWSPDGALIAFDTTRNNIMCIPGAAPCSEIYVMNADGKDQRRIASEPVLGTVSDWQSLTPKQALRPSGSTIQFSDLSYAVAENAGSVTIRVTRLGDLSGEASVDYATSDGTASQRSDYTPMFGTLRFAPGEGDKTITIPITDNAFVRGDRTVNVTLNNAQGALHGATTVTLLTITEDDTSPPTTNPLDTAQYFVQQHYYDFLSRVSDPSGLAFWTNEITSCGADARCLEVKRINVSAAFFFSIEFQETGYFVYRMYQAAFNTGERLKRADFLPDTQAVGTGVSVGQPGWELKLQTNKRAYADSFAARPAFLERYPATMSYAQYVDALNANTGGSLSPAERDALINRLKAGQIKRGEALWEVAEDADFARREFNRAFVLMQYFGYLRRNPDDAPDADFGGYQFWLQKLNQFHGNFIEAEMVKAFIVSSEYRARFGQ